MSCASSLLAWWLVVATLDRICNTLGNHLPRCLLSLLSRDRWGKEIDISSADGLGRTF